MTRLMITVSPDRRGRASQDDFPVTKARLRLRRTVLWGGMGLISARRGWMTALLASFLALFVLVSAVEAATCTPESLTAHVAESVADAPSESDGPGSEQNAICAHGHCHHSGVTALNIPAVSEVFAPHQETMRVPPADPLGSSAPAGLDRPPQG